MLVKLYINFFLYFCIILDQGFPKGGLNLKNFVDELTIDILELQMRSKKKDLGVNVSNFETCTRYFGVAGEKQKSKKAQGVICLFKLSKGGDLKK